MAENLPGTLEWRGVILKPKRQRRLYYVGALGDVSFGVTNQGLYGDQREYWMAEINFEEHKSENTGKDHYEALDLAAAKLGKKLRDTKRGVKLLINLADFQDESRRSVYDHIIEEE